MLLIYFCLCVCIRLCVCGFFVKTRMDSNNTHGDMFISSKQEWIPTIPRETCLLCHP